MYKERISLLMSACVGDPDDLKFIEERVNNLYNYVHHVSFMETRMQRLRIEGITGELWRDEVTRLDDMRRSKHEVAMDSINQLNRLAAAVEVPPHLRRAG